MAWKSQTGQNIVIVTMFVPRTRNDRKFCPRVVFVSSSVGGRILVHDGRV